MDTRSFAKREFPNLEGPHAFIFAGDNDFFYFIRVTSRSLTLKRIDLATFDVLSSYTCSVSYTGTMNKTSYEYDPHTGKLYLACPLFLDVLCFDGKTLALLGFFRGQQGNDDRYLCIVNPFVFATSDSKGNILIYDTNGDGPSEIRLSHNTRGLSVSPCRQYIVSNLSSNYMSVFSMKTSRLQLLDFAPAEYTYYTKAGFTTDGRYMTLSTRNTFRFFSLESKARPIAWIATPDPLINMFTGIMCDSHGGVCAISRYSFYSPTDEQLDRFIGDNADFRENIAAGLLMRDYYPDGRCNLTSRGVVGLYRLGLLMTANFCTKLHGMLLPRHVVRLISDYLVRDEIIT